MGGEAVTMRPPLTRRAGRVDLSREGRGEETQFVGGGKTLPRRVPTSPLTGEVDAQRAAGEGGLSSRDFARHLRTNMTEAEWRLWQALRGRRFEGYKFRRQVPVGIYVADFVCFDRRLIVELDGSHHVDSASDARRDQWLTAQGFRVLRYPNIAVFEALDGTLLAILDALKER